MKVAFLINTLLRVGDRNTATLVECNSTKKILDKNIKISIFNTSKFNKN
jgi:hypothetical protein